MELVRSATASKAPLQRVAVRYAVWFTPVTLLVCEVAWLASGDPARALAVLVVATPCPLILAIPVAIIGGVSLAARRGIVIRDPAVLERLESCRTVIFDKTGTLTYGKPTLTDVALMGGWQRREVLSFAASVEQYSKHPLAAAVLSAAREEGIPLGVPDEIAELPGRGLELGGED